MIKTREEFFNRWVIEHTSGTTMLRHHECVMLMRAYEHYVLQEKIKKLEEEKSAEPSYLYNEGIDKAIEILKQK